MATGASIQCRPRRWGELGDRQHLHEVVGKTAIAAAGEPTGQERAALAACAEHRSTGTGSNFPI